jgi:hypothetical protein
MWPFRRRTATTSVAPVHRAGPADWRRLAPITLVQASPTTTVDRGFESRLATRQSPLFVEPLGHQLTSDGPSGRVAAAVVPGAPRQYAAPPPVQRQTMTFDPLPAHTSDALSASTTTITDGPELFDARDAIDVDDSPAPAPVRPTLAASTPSVTATATQPSLVAAADPQLPPLTFPPSASQPRVPAPPVVSRDLDDGGPAGTAAHATGHVEHADAIEHSHPIERASHADHLDHSDHSDHLDHLGHLDDLDDLDRAGHVDPSDRSEVVGLVGGDTPAPSTPAADAPATPSPRPVTDPAPRAVQRAVADPAAPHEGASRTTSGASEPVPPPGVAATRDDPPRLPTITGPGEAHRSRTVLGAPVSPAGTDPRAATPLQRTPTQPAPFTRPTAPVGPQRAAPAHQPASEAADAPAETTAPLLPGAGIPTTVAHDPLTHRDDATVERRSTEPPVAPRNTSPSTESTAETPEQAVAPVTPAGVVEQRPTLAAEWLPTIARTGLDPTGDAAARHEQVQSEAAPASTPHAPFGGDHSAPASSIGAVTSEPGTAPWTAGEIVPTLGSPDVQAGSSAPAPAPRRIVVGPPISRVAVQRAPLAADTSRARGGHVDGNGDAHDAVTPVDSGRDTLDLSALPITEWPPVQRQTDTSAAAPPPADISPTSPTAPSAAVTMEATEPSEGATGRSDAEIQELLRTLYPPLRRRLCRDLLLDRERAGYGTDIRF